MIPWLLVLAPLLAQEPAPPPAAGPGPWSDPRDPTVWPNQASRSNSDPWLVENHDRIRRMNPRLLVLNFSNQIRPEEIERQTNRLIAALAESSRYHGYAEPSPIFLRYEVFKVVDLRDPDRATGNSRRSPIKKHVKEGINMDYGALLDETFAGYYGVRHPANPSRFLRLDELVDLGYVHEVWFFASATGDLRCLECIEKKPAYNEGFHRLGNEFREAGNGSDPDMRWTGRSLRINCLNPERGPGCGMENLGHCLEWMATSGCIPYFSRYFREYAEHDLDTRWKLPFNSLYAVGGEGARIEYPDPGTAVIHLKGRVHRIENYSVRGGNVHFAPNSRGHYDLESPRPVLSTIEDWRIGSGPGGRDVAKPFTVGRLDPFRKVAPDCMGPWLVYWRQNMPGLDNRQKDDRGRPMKNWWPFLFY